VVSLLILTIHIKGVVMADDVIVQKFNTLSAKVESVKASLEKFKARRTALEEQKASILTKLQADYGITSYEQLRTELDGLTTSLNQSLSVMEQVLSKVNV